MRREGTPTRRRVVALYTAVGLVALMSVVGLTNALRLQSPAPRPPVPEVTDATDPLRQPVECSSPEGQRQARPVSPPMASSAELYDCPRTWDGRLVRYVGEAVGAVLDRDDHAWIQLNDDVYADGSGPLPTHRDFRGGNAGIGARLDPAASGAIAAVGGPGVRGDLVEVIATFHRVHEASAEVAVLEVESLTVLRRGGPFDQPQAPGRALVATIAALAALGVVVAERRRRLDR